MSQSRLDQAGGTGTPPGSGALFGLAVTDRGVYYVDDATNTLNIFL